VQALPKIASEAIKKVIPQNVKDVAGKAVDIAKNVSKNVAPSTPKAIALNTELQNARENLPLTDKEAHTTSEFLTTQPTTEQSIKNSPENAPFTSNLPDTLTEDQHQEVFSLKNPPTRMNIPHGGEEVETPSDITQRADGGRIMRASGGRADNHERLVNRLMTMADKAKKITNKTTEPLLNSPDESIVKALAMAQQAI
jgi:hypothetical protein